MSTTTPTGPATTIDVNKSAPTPFHRLVAVEWRKMIDTRGGFWLLAITAGLLVLVMALIVLVVGINDYHVSAEGISQGLTIPVSLLLPVFAVLIVTSEWGQRTALTTFTLEPHRGKVIVAKLAAVSSLAVATIVIALLLGVLTNLACAGVTGNELRWEIDGTQLLWSIVVQLLYFAMGFALGMLLLNTPGAIAIYYVVGLMLPFMLWSTLFALFDWAQDLIPWIDINFAAAPLISGYDFNGNPAAVDATTYLQVLVSASIWVVVPVVLGMWRILRAEVK